MIPLHDPDIRRWARPYVVYVLLAANLAVFLYQLGLSDLDEFIFTYRFGVIPFELTASEEFTIARLGGSITVDLTSPIPTWATVFSSMFVHGGFMHIAGNMLFLWVFGDNVEDRLGHFKFLAFYLLAGVAAVWAQVLVDTASEVPMVGASGAIAGVLGTYILFFPFSRIHTLIVFGFILHVRLPALVLIGTWAVLQVFNGAGSMGASSAGSGVAYFAHLGGFAAGVTAAVLHRLLRREPIWPGRRPPGRPSGGRYLRGRPID